MQIVHPDALPQHPAGMLHTANACLQPQRSDRVTHAPMQAYLKRYGHQLNEEKRADIERLIREAEEEDAE